MPEKRKFPRRSNIPFGTTIVKVCVGTEEEPFFIHKSLLCSTSGFFKNALEGNWKEAETGIVNLPDDDPDTFSLYMELLYTGKVRNDPDYRTFLPLSHLYVLAEKLLDVTAKNSVLDTMLLSSRTGNKMYPGLDSVRAIYEGTPGPCPARKLMVDFYAYRGCPQKMGEWIKIPDFADDLINTLLEINKELMKIKRADVASSFGWDASAPPSPILDPTKTCSLDSYHQD